MSVEFPYVFSVTPSKIIRAFLIEKKIIGGSPALKDGHAWPSSYGKMPDDPAQMVTLYTGSPINDGHLMVGEFIQHPTVQIMTRSTNPDVGEELLADIQIAFNQIRPTDYVQLENSSEQQKRFQLHAAKPISNVAPLGSEHQNNLIQANSKVPREVAKNDRRLFSLTYLFTITEVEPVT